MVYELRTYTVKAGGVPTVAKNAGEVAREIRGDDYGKLEGRAEIRAQVTRDEDWRRFIADSAPLLADDMRSTIKLAAAHSPLK